MNIFERYRTRKFFWRILTTNIMLVVLFLLIFCLVIYQYSRNAAMNLQQDANRKVLNQINYNIDNLNEMVRNITIAAYNDKDVGVLMNTGQWDVFEFYNKMMKLDQFVVSNSFVQSITVYNGNNSCTYSNSATAPVLCGKEGPSMLERLLSGGEELPKLTLFPYKEQEGAAGWDSFAYLMYEAERYAKGSSALLVTVKPEWLLDNMRKLNELADNPFSFVGIIDQAGNVLDRQEHAVFSGEARGDIVSRLQEEQNSSGHFTADVNGEKQLVTYLSSKVNNWRMITMQPYHLVFERIDRIGTFSLIALLIFISLSLLASAVFSVRLYRPVGRLLTQLSPSRSLASADAGDDEWRYLSRVYSGMQDSVKLLKEKDNANQHVFDQFFLRQWLTDSTSIDEGQFIRFAAESPWLHGRLVLCLLKQDDGSSLREERSSRELKLLRFAASNISGEILGKIYRIHSADMMNDDLVLIIGLEDGSGARPEDGITAETDLYAVLDNLIVLAQKTVEQYYHFTFTAVFSDVFADYTSMTRHYEQVQHLSNYRMLLGRGAVITPERYARQGEPAAEAIPLELDRKLMESIRSNQRDQMQERLDEIFIHISRLHSEQVDDAILHVLALVKQSLREMNQNRLQPLAVDMQSFTRQVLEKETLQDVQRMFGQKLQEFTSERKQSTQEKPEFLTAAVKEMVEVNYTDPSLSLQSVADVLKLSAGYLGRYFRSKEGVSVAEYINQVRLNQALQLLEEGSRSVVDIMRQVGYTNESNFFKLFKKKTGVTPNEYRMRKNL
ncbi:MAG: AraC family transcriptional regulator [Paenibacillaceae bacterium]|jgi:AraC-like DNA-binding protein|nr:AraC family transcriptional regulator [Paenibacillaceae bacterium]